MQKLTAYRDSHPAYNVLLFIISFSFLIVWLPLLRSAFDGVSYQWGMSYFGITLGGKGITPAYSFLVLQLIFYVALFISVYWIKNRTIFYGLLGIWWVHFFGNILFGIAQDPSISFQGDTLGVSVPLIYIILPLCLIALGLIIWVIRIDKKQENVSIPWSRKNRLLSLIIFGPLPLQFLLLHFGAHLSGMDQIGVVISILQCLLIPLPIKPYTNALEPALDKG